MENEPQKECDHDYKETENGLYCFRCGTLKETTHEWEKRFILQFPLEFKTEYPGKEMLSFIRQELARQAQEIRKEILAKIDFMFVPIKNGAGEEYLKKEEIKKIIK